MPVIAKKEVGVTGYGLMRLTSPELGYSHEDAIPVMKAAFEQGARLWNGADFYGPAHNNSLHLVKAYFTQYPEDASKVVFFLKSWAPLDSDGKLVMIKEYGREDSIRSRVENALAILDGVKSIDIFENARMDPDVEVEETMEAMLKLVKEGKIGGAGMTEVGEKTIRRAAKIMPIAAVENEVSLFSSEGLSNGSLQACKELGIPVVAYSPLGRGMLSGRLQSIKDLPDLEFIRAQPRFQEEAFATNLKLVQAVKEIADNKGCTVPQVALAWVRGLSATYGLILPIPGAMAISRVQENTKIITLTSEEMDALTKIAQTFEIAGSRYPPQFMHLCDF